MRSSAGAGRLRPALSRGTGTPHIARDARLEVGLRFRQHRQDLRTWSSGPQEGPPREHGAGTNQSEKRPRRRAAPRSCQAPGRRASGTSLAPTRAFVEVHPSVPRRCVRSASSCSRACHLRPTQREHEDLVATARWHASDPRQSIRRLLHGLPQRQKAQLSAAPDPLRTPWQQRADRGSTYVSLRQPGSHAASMLLIVDAP